MIEFKLEVNCEFCGASLDYIISGDITGKMTPRKIAIRVVPCSKCTSDVLEEAWKSIKGKHDKSANAED